VAGSLALSRGVVFVGTETRTARVRTFDLDGRPLEARFTFAAPDGGAASADGLAVDEDRRIWVADGVGRRLVAFTLFGDRVATVGPEPGPDRDRRGVLGRPSAVATRGADDEHELLVASAGRRRHGVQRLDLGRGTSATLRSGGHVDATFNDPVGLAWEGRLAWVCERGAGRVQVFRDLDFHFDFRLRPAGGLAFRPNAVRPLPDGRLVLAQGGEASAVLLLDGSGRLLRVLAQAGDEEGWVREPSDLVVDPGADDRHTRIVVIDREGTRVQVLNLEGECHGTFPDLVGSEPAWELP
jgi:sugar lactone lactonase YvrE